MESRQREILKLAAAGYTDKEIAVRLHISTSSIRSYWDRLKLKLGADSRTHAVALTLESQLEQAQATVCALANALTDFYGDSAVIRDGQLISLGDQLRDWLQLPEGEPEPVFWWREFDHCQEMPWLLQTIRGKPALWSIRLVDPALRVIRMRELAAPPPVQRTLALRSYLQARSGTMNVASSFRLPPQLV